MRVYSCFFQNIINQFIRLPKFDNLNIQNCTLHNIGNCLFSPEQYNPNLERCICNQNNIVTYSCQLVSSESDTFEKAPRQHPQLEQY